MNDVVKREDTVMVSHAQEKDVRKPLVKLLETVDYATNRGYLSRYSNALVEKFPDKVIETSTTGLTKSLHQTHLFRLTRLVYGADEDPVEKLKSFFLVFHDMKQCPSVYFILQNKKVDSDKYDFNLYLGVRPQGLEQSDDDIREVHDVFEATFNGSFLGSKITEWRDKKDIKESIFEKVICENPEVVCVTVQPSVKKDTDEKTTNAGLERFIDIMRDREYTAVLLAQPVSMDVVEERRRDLENLYSKLTLFQKMTIAFGKNASKTIGENISNAIGSSESVGTSFTKTRNSSTSTSEGGGSSSSSGSNGFSSGSSSSWNKTETFGMSESEGTTFNLGKSSTQTTGSNTSETQGESITQTIETQNKAIVDLLARMDDTLKRMDDAKAFGLWECAGYFLAPEYDDAAFAANSYKALVVGDESSSICSHTIRWSRKGNRGRQESLCQWIFGGEHPHLIPQGTDKYFAPTIIPTNLISGKDLPYFLRLPLKSVPGIAVETIAAFGRSVSTKGLSEEPKRRIVLGNICHMNQEEMPVGLDLNDFTKHVFITGSTGCGKSNTTELLLQRCIENKVNFLVVEPAKGEYKKAFKNHPGINIFTTNPLCERLLRVNPFKFPDGIHVLEHVDRLLEIFSACWELTAAMPAILKKGVEQAYRNVGWDTANSYFVGDGRKNYPTFASLISTLTDIIDNSGYSAEAKGNYKGALVTRVESLTAGVLRQIFCSGMDLEDKTLFDENTIVDLSRLGSSETKALLMGILVMQLSEWRQTNAKGTNRDLNHVTVIEEAHNLLRRQEPGGSDLVRKSVESISNAIAEMRTYGEGFLIVDQSPGAVDISAIKNTNTKIVMRLPEQNDCEAIAGAMGLDEFQTKEIAKLSPGVAVVMQNTWTSAILCKVEKSDPPRGEEEWTDADENRMIRAQLALLCGDVRLKKAEDGKLAVEQLPDVRSIEAQIDKFDNKIGPVRKKELHDIFAYCNSAYGLEKQAGVFGVLKACGMLAITLLGCWDCWRDVKNKNSFRETLMRYLTPKGVNSVSNGEEYAKLLKSHFDGLLQCVVNALVFKAILHSGGTEEDSRGFFAAMKRTELSRNRK